MSRPLEEHEESTLRPSWLIRHATQLVSKDATTDLPRTARPRRAVSAAYYAVFHGVALEVVSTALPQAGRDVWFPLCRILAHEDLRSVCAWVKGDPCAKWATPLVDASRQSADLQNLGIWFVTLHKERELADYDHRTVFDRQAALTSIRQARDALEVLGAMNVSDPAWQAFGALALLHSSPKKRPDR